MILIVFFILSISSCSSDDDVTPPIVEASVDTTTNCRSVTETGAYMTFYKPQSGYVGDPMPYYNADDQLFYLYYLQDWRNGAPTDHPIYCINTSDYSRFWGFSEAIPCGVAGSQETLLGTGSFIKDDKGTLYGYYTGHNGSLYPAEKVMLATSNDMKTFTKKSLYTMEAPDGYDKNNFRDPFVYYDPIRSLYVMVVTTLKDGKGVLARFTSSDLLNWSSISPLTDFDSDAEILECPDIFQMGTKWYLVFSRINRDEHRKTFYRISDSPEGPWKQCEDESGIHETFDGLFLYAAKTSLQGNNRFLSGWCSTGQEVNGKNELDWAGSLITHKLVQQESGKLYPSIVEAINDKFKFSVDFLNLKNKGNVSGGGSSYILEANDERSYVQFNRNTTPVKITMKIDASQSNRFGFSFGACDDLSELYSVTFDLTESNRWSMPALFLYQESIYSTGSYEKELNFTPLIVPANKNFDITILIEKSVCVIYVNNNVAFTNRIYKMDKNPWTFFVDQGAISVSDLKIYKESEDE